MVARLTSIFGALALLLASLGLYGTISYGISRRVSELGLRMALGADRGTVLWMVLAGGAVRWSSVGPPSASHWPWPPAAARGPCLFDVGAADPLSFAGGAGLLLVVAAVAAYLPAYRASRIEPMVALGR